LEYLAIDNRIILKWILNRMGGCGVDSCGSGFEAMVGSCEFGKEPFGFKRCREFLEWLRNYNFLK
jgi:hypothetical protein